MELDILNCGFSSFALKVNIYLSVDGQLEGNVLYISIFSNMGKADVGKIYTI